MYRLMTKGESLRCFRNLKEVVLCPNMEILVLFLGLSNQNIAFDRLQFSCWLA